jgi:hypothetical protein
MSFWEFLWFIVITYVFVAYLMLFFHIIGDLIRDPETGGFAKVMWSLLLVFLPFLGTLIYLIARGRGMAERSVASMEQQRAAQEAYIRQVAVTGSSATEQISQAKSLLDAGAITQQEYDGLKAKAFATT